jgi:hypothetical protein
LKTGGTVSAGAGLPGNKAGSLKLDEAKVAGWAAGIALTRCREHSDGKCPHLASGAQRGGHAYTKRDLAEARKLLTSLHSHGIEPTAVELGKLSRLLRAFS